MAEPVKVAGCTVTQEKLERMFSALRARHWFGIPQWYRPRLEDFKPVVGTKARLEAILYDYMESGSMPPWFSEQFADRVRRRPEDRRDPERLMESAGFPRIAWATRHPWEEEVPERLAEWAGHVADTAPPWAWVVGGDADERTNLMAKAALAASDRLPADALATYRQARDLCEEVASASNYGANSKRNVMMPYRTCDLLLLDGLGTERRAAPELNGICAVLRERRDRMLPTVIGSHMEPSAAAKSFASVSREASDELMATVIECLSAYGTRPLNDGVMSLDALRG